MCTETTGAPLEATDGSLEEGLLCLLKPAVETISGKVEAVLKSQEQLGAQIDCLSTDLDQLAQKQTIPIDIDHYTRNLANSKRRVLLLGSSVNSIQERLTRLQRQITLEIAKRRNILEATPNTPSHPQEYEGSELKQKVSTAADD